MPINVRYENELVILSNFGPLMNDPRHVDASKDVREELDEGRRKFVMDLGGVRDLGSAGLGLLMTLTRLIRRFDGDAVLVNLSVDSEKLLDEMRMDTYWEIFPNVVEAKQFYQEASDAG